MVRLEKNKRKKILKIILVSLFVAVSFFLAYFLFFYERTIENPSPDNDEWNQTDENPLQPIDPLYNLTEVPKLEALLINPDFIKWINIEQLPYLHGYSSDGRYAAFIYYIENNRGYIIQVYNTFVGELAYSTFIQDTENLIDSKELALVQDALDNNFKINVVPDKHPWASGMEYETENGIWLFENETKNKYSFLTISKTTDEEIKWRLLQNKNINFDENVQLFSYPEKPEWLVFIFKQKLFDNSSAIEYTPYFIQLDNFTINNSENGKREEADKWLYGDFKFIYSQWDSGSNKGFLAVSKENNEINGKKHPDSIEQWVYLDPLGKMKWYGNAKGIFNAEGKSIQTSDKIYYYRVRVTYNYDRNSIDYYVVDQYEAKTNNLERTVEFAWNYEKQEMASVQDLQIFEENDTN